jgi:hypothetical protein
MKRRTSLMVAAWCLALSAPLDAAAQDSLASARDLYASAAYEDALAVLNRLPAAPRSADDTRAIAEYRAFCLLALGRSTEAERAIESLIAEQPMARPMTNDMSPRVRTAFTDVRRRILPELIQQRYTDAKAAFDRKEFSAASQGFQQVLDMMTDPDVAPSTSKPPLSDLRMLATGFKDLAVSAIPPPPLAARPVPVAKVAEPAPVEPKAAAAPPPAAAPTPPPAAAATPAVARAPRVFVASDPTVVPPMIVRQDLPPFPGVITTSKQGLIEIVIDENGDVESATIRATVTPMYDVLALAATKLWRYRAASVDGHPVKFRKFVQVNVSPPPRR